MVGWDIGKTHPLSDFSNEVVAGCFGGLIVLSGDFFQAVVVNVQIDWRLAAASL